MAISRRHRSWISGNGLRAAAVDLALAILLGLTVVASQPVQAQTYKVIHNFTGASDGGNPEAGLTMDGAGNLYGTASGGGDLACNAPYGCGTVYKLTHKGSGWTFNPLYSFAGGSDGASPEARVIFGRNGTLYGTTVFGGKGGCNDGANCGTVFHLSPSPRACTTALCAWTETVLYPFGIADGAYPEHGDLTFDQAGNIYGTAYAGGSNRVGVVYELTPSGSSWTENVLYNFSGNDGLFPYSGVILDNAGNLYGTAYSGGSPGAGTVFQLTYTGSGWRESLPYNFQDESDGGFPFAGVIFDQSGNLYGATTNSGSGSGGTVFKLTPSGGTWTYFLIYSFTGTLGGCGPWVNLVMDGAANLYGTTYCDGANNAGSVFKLTHLGNGWTYSSLHDFTGGSDGGNPVSNVVFDANGNLYGTASAGGTSQNCRGGCGVVWEITP